MRLSICLSWSELIGMHANCMGIGDSCYHIYSGGRPRCQSDAPPQFTPPVPAARIYDTHTSGFNFRMGSPRTLRAMDMRMTPDMHHNSESISP